jgi:hypothetical protein
MPDRNPTVANTVHNHWQIKTGSKIQVTDPHSLHILTLGAGRGGGCLDGVERWGGGGG